MRQIIRSRRQLGVRTLSGCAAVCLLLTSAPRRLEGQTPGSLLSGINPIGDNPQGFHLYNVTGYAGWTSLATPRGGFLSPQNGGLGPDTNYGGEASMGWVTGNERSRFSALYSGGYGGELRYSQWNAFYHFLTLSASRRLSSRWSLSLGAHSSLSTYNQMQFTPTLFGSLVAAPGSFDDLASAVLAGQYNNDQLASLLTGAPVIESPSSALLFGNRVFSSAGTVGLNYAHSQRLTIGFNAGFSNVQHLADSNDGARYRYLAPRASCATAGVSLSYALSPRTEIGVEARSSRGFSILQNSYSSSGNAFVGHQTGRHWFMRASAGAGFVTTLRSNYPSRLGTRPVYSGELGYRAYAHTFMATYQRMIGSAYGVAASDVTTVGGAWRWWRPGRTWGLSSSGMEELLRGSVFSNITGWRGTFGITKQMGPHMVAEAGYSYASYSGGALSGTSPAASGSPFSEHQHTVRLTLAWYPQSMERR